MPGLCIEFTPGSHVDGFHIDNVRLHESTTSNEWLPGGAVPEVEQLKKRKYHLTKWPHSGLADQLIESIGGNPDSIQYKSDLLTSFGALPCPAQLRSRPGEFISAFHGSRRNDLTV